MPNVFCGRPSLLQSFYMSVFVLSTISIDRLETDETGETVVATTDREDTFEKEAEDRDETTPVPVTATEVVGKKLTNQFNFSERASQTYNNPYRVRHLVASVYTERYVRQTGAGFI